jgi:hypothetical protein
MATTRRRKHPVAVAFAKLGAKRLSSGGDEGDRAEGSARSLDKTGSSSTPCCSSGFIQSLPVTVLHLVATFLPVLWVDNSPGWCAVMLRSAGKVLSLKPG